MNIDDAVLGYLGRNPNATVREIRIAIDQPGDRVQRVLQRLYVRRRVERIRPPQESSGETFRWRLA